MDKDLIIRVINNYYSDNCSMDNVARLIALYCKDRGKREDDIIKLMSVLLSLPMHDMAKDAISWYTKELNLTTINRIENNQLKPFKIV